MIYVSESVWYFPKFHLKGEVYPYLFLQLPAETMGTGMAEWMESRRTLYADDMVEQALDCLFSDYFMSERNELLFCLSHSFGFFLLRIDESTTLSISPPLHSKAAPLLLLLGLWLNSRCLFTLYFWIPAVSVPNIFYILSTGTTL